MSKIQKVRDITELELLEYAEKYESATQILKEVFNMSANGNYTAIINAKMREWDIEFLYPWTPNKKYNKIIKKCPICNKEFETSKNSPDEKTTCSYSCANTYFRSGKNNGNYTGTNYRTICFSYHKKECIICGENKIIAVHHYDENHKNNLPENLVPLCPTHHQYIHSKHKELIEDEVAYYIKQFLMRVSLQGGELGFQPSA